MSMSVWPVLGLLLLVGGLTREAESAEPQQPVPNRVQALDYATLPGGRIIIRLIFKEELKAPPTLFTSYHPIARIVLGFEQTASGVGRDPVEVGQGDVRSLQLVQSGTRAQLIINVARPLVLETAITGNELLITLQRPRALGPGDPGRPFSAVAPDGPRHAVREVGFERGPAGEGRIVLGLSDEAIPIEVRQQGRTLIVDFAESALPPGLERRLDVRDFGTAVQAIETYRLGGGVRMTIELAGAAEFSVYQVSRRFTVSPH